MNEEKTVVKTSLLPTLAIVGRPNVGKSSLFNAILKRRCAIVHFDSGVTRDRVSATGLINGRRFNLVDTGGLGMYSGETRNVGFWDKSIERQVEVALDEAEMILFTVDAQDGLTELDKEIARRLRTTGKPILLVINKVDGEGELPKTEEFDKLGFAESFPVSCLQRRGIQYLMERALHDVEKSGVVTEVPRLKIAVIGRPNVGKSSIVNRMLGEERVIVSDIAGTTRDSIDVDFTLRCGEEDVPATLVDTAGLRKRSKVDNAVERYSTMRAEETLNNCDIALFVISSCETGATSQDKTIAGMIEDSGKACIIVSNKWDECKGKKPKEILEEIRYTLPKMTYAPVVFTAASTGYNFKELYATIAEIRAQMAVKISTAMVNRVIGDATEKTHAPVLGTKPFKIYYGTMVSNLPPTFALFVNDPKLCADHYKTYLEKYMRKSFQFVGLPIRIVFRERERRELVFPKVKTTGKNIGKNPKKKSKNYRPKPYRVDKEKDKD